MAALSWFEPSWSRSRRGAAAERRDGGQLVGGEVERRERGERGQVGRRRQRVGREVERLQGRERRQRQGVGQAVGGQAELRQARAGAERAHAPGGERVGRGIERAEVREGLQPFERREALPLHAAPRVGDGGASHHADVGQAALEREELRRRRLLQKRVELIARQRAVALERQRVQLLQRLECSSQVKRVRDVHERLQLASSVYFGGELLATDEA